MPARRASRLTVPLHSFLEEYARDVAAQVATTLAQHHRAQTNALNELTNELRRLSRRLDRVATGGVGRPPRDGRRCKVGGCFQPHVAKGYCKNHYQQVRYRDKKAAEARAEGKRYAPPKPGERRPGRKPKVPLPA